MQNTSGGTFTFMSDRFGSATAGQIASNATGFTGPYNIQRYVSAVRSYRLLSSQTNLMSASAPTTYDHVADMAYLAQSTTAAGSTYLGAYTAGPSGSSFPHTNAAGNAVLYLYQESLTPGTNFNSSFTSGNNVGVVNYSSGGSSSTITTKTTVAAGTNTNQDNVSGVKIPAGNGFLLYYIGSSSTSAQSGVAPDTCNITATGYMNQGTIPVYFWGKTPSNSLSVTTGSRYPGLVMLGNPYPSTIDLQQFYSDNDFSAGFFGNDLPLTGTFYQFNGLNSSSFPTFQASYGGSSGTSSAEYVASGEGFYAVVNNTQIIAFGYAIGNTSVSFNEGEKVTNSVSNSFAAVNPSASEPKLLYSNLHLKLYLDSTKFDECGIYLNKKWADSLDSYDSRDMDGLSPTVYLSSFTSNNVRTSINALGDYTNGKRIKLYVRATTDNIYHLSLEDIKNIDTTNYQVYLIDKKLNDSLDMVHYKTYTFNFYTADTASFSNRFVLVLEPKPLPPYKLITFSGQKASNKVIQLNWKTTNEGNYTNFGLEKLGANGQYSLIDSVQSNSLGGYSFNDQNPVSGNNIYRLAQTDIHGKVAFAGPINIDYSSTSANGLFTIYPNPSKDIINIAVNSGTTGSQPTPVYLASIYSLSGTVMDSKQVNTNNWTQDVTSYKAGVYILELKTTDGNIVGEAKFVKTN